MLVFVVAVSTALVVSFLCSIFESVLLSVGPARAEAMARSGLRSGELLRDFKRRIDVPISAILIVNTVAHTIGATVAGASYVDVFGAESLWLFSLIFTVAVLLLTEIIPKTLGVTHARSLAGPVAHALHWLTWMLRPLVWLTAALSSAVRGHHEAPPTSEEDIRVLAALGRREGVVGSRTAGIIEGATRLGRLRVSDVMVPRQQVVFLDGRLGLDEIIATIRDSGHSRFPWSQSGRVDDISGVVLAKELMLATQGKPGAEPEWEVLLKDPLVVPTTKSLNAMLRTFLDVRQHLAIVVDEYGGTEGIVSLEDVLEELVGDILDESDRSEPDLWPQDDGSLVALATIETRRLCRHLGVEWLRREDEATLAGVLASRLDRVPTMGDVIEWQGHRVEVISASDKRAERIRVTRIDEAPADAS